LTSPGTVSGRRCSRCRYTTSFGWGRCRCRRCCAPSGY
jgi:hypothetical protein